VASSAGRAEFHGPRFNAAALAPALVP